MRSICSKVSLFRCWCAGSSCVLYTVWKWNKQVKAALKRASAAFFFFFFFSAVTLQKGGQLFSRGEGLTPNPRLLTHLAHLYGREKAKKKKKKMHCWYLELIQLGLTGHEHQHGLPHLPNEIVPFEKASTNVYIPSCSAV